MSQQPSWRTVYATDYSKLEVDQTGVYDPELTIAIDVDESYSGEPGRWEVYRFGLERCTYGNGVLSDNPYHPEVAAWFADDLASVARSCGSTWTEMVTALCSLDPRARAWAYESIAWYHGEMNFDGYPLTVDNAELAEMLK